MADEPPSPILPPEPVFFTNVVPAMIAGAVIVYFGVSLFLPFFVEKAPLDPSYIRGLSTLENILLLVIGYYFGSNNSSQRKTELLAAKPPITVEPPKE